MSERAAILHVIRAFTDMLGGKPTRDIIRSLEAATDELREPESHEISASENKAQLDEMAREVCPEGAKEP